MTFRVPILRTIAILALPMFMSPAGRADDATAKELKALRQIVEQQSKQIEVLSALVSHLSAKIEGHAEAVTPAAAAPAADNGDFAVPAARVVPPHPTANVHIVVKGESLDKIAKTNGTTVTELQKLNHISDPKRLQIGQQLVLPPSTPKKEPQ